MLYTWQVDLRETSWCPSWYDGSEGEKLNWLKQRSPRLLFRWDVDGGDDDDLPLLWQHYISIFDVVLLFLGCLRSFFCKTNLILSPDFRDHLLLCMPLLGLLKEHLHSSLHLYFSFSVSEKECQVEVINKKGNWFRNRMWETREDGVHLLFPSFFFLVSLYSFVPFFMISFLNFWLENISLLHRRSVSLITSGHSIS